MSRRLVIGLGSSLGDRRRLLQGALCALAATPGLGVERCSRVVVTAPVGGVARCAFWNAAVLARSDLPPEELVARLHAIERRFGRRRGRAGMDRTLDLDLLWVEGVRQDGPVTVPHPRLTARPFALWPLLEVAPDARLPEGPALATFRSGLGRPPSVAALRPALRSQRATGTCDPPRALPTTEVTP